jgi:ABC-type nitrate/sulfonate/bicarbonate transport system permease component
MKKLARIHPNYIRITSLVIIIVIWQIVANHVNPMFIATPSAIFMALIQMLKDGELLGAILFSMKTLFVGFAISVVLGIIFGLLIGRYRLLENSLDFIINALYVTPLVALIPLIILWFGLGFTAKIFIVVLMAVFPILINTWAGVQKVSPNLIELGISFCANERQLFNKIIIHATLPYIMTGIRLGIGRGIIGMVIAEFFTAIGGLGGLIVNAGNHFQTAKMFVPIILLMVLGIAFTEVVKYLEKKIAPWQVQE